MKRHYCTYCKAKVAEKYMTKIYYKFLHKHGWICAKHLSDNTDILQISNVDKSNVFLEFFSGSKHISQVAESFGYRTFTVDNQKDLSPDLCKDIRRIKLTELPGSVKIIWASIPCTVYSILNIKNHWEQVPVSWRNYYYVPKTKEAKEAIQILEKTIWLINRMNPTYYFIENPRGALRHMPQMKYIPFRHTVSYSDYGFEYYKPTDIFTNAPDLVLTKIKTAVGQTFEKSICDLSGAYERSLVPPLLIQSILSQLKT